MVEFYFFDRYWIPSVGGVRRKLIMAGGKEEDVGLDELGEGSKEVVSKIREFGGDIGSELLGDRGGEVLFGGGKGGEEVVIEMDKDDVYIEEFWERYGFGVRKF
ncbi:hypothetical protein Tco_1493183 [Tanacetum coccineum]